MKISTVLKVRKIPKWALFILIFEIATLDAVAALPVFTNVNFPPNLVQQRSSVSDDTIHTLTNITREKLHPDRYDRRIRPGILSGPLNVMVSMHVASIPYVSELEQEIHIDFYFRQTWTDYRLAFNTSDLPSNFTYVSIGGEFIESIWHPDTFFDNEKDAHTHRATVENSFFRWYPNGTIQNSLRLTLKASCAMNLQNYPMDEQQCSIYASSYGLTSEDLAYHWESHDPVAFGKKSLWVLQNFDVEKFRTSATVMNFSTGTYTVLGCDFLLKRSTQYYLITVFVPAGMLVVMSWFALYVDVTAVSERLALGVTAVLTVITLLVSTQEQAPKISYIKALDIYMWVSFFFVFMSLFESTTVGFLARAANRTAKRRFKTLTKAMKRRVSSGGSGSPSSPMEMLNVDWEEPSFDVEPGADAYCCGRCCNNRWTKKLPPGLRKYKGFDISARILFPTCFFVFNLAYWLYYFNVPKVGNEEGWILIDPSIPRDVV